MFNECSTKQENIKTTMIFPIHFVWSKISQNAHFALLVYSPKFDEVKMQLEEFQKKQIQISQILRYFDTVFQVFSNYTGVYFFVHRQTDRQTEGPS